MCTIYLTDMSKCLPQSALAQTLQPKHWQVAEYEAEGLSGTMVVVGRLSDAPDLRYLLDVKGWHAIHVGYSTQIHGERSSIRVRLKSDPCFTTITDDELDELDVMTLREVFWKYADLTGEEILFGQHRKGAGSPTSGMQSGAVAYVKLEPLSDSQVKAIQADRADTSKRRIIASNDGGFVGWRNASTEEDILEQVELYRHSDVGRIDWSVVSGEITKYPSKIGNNLHERNGDEAGNAYGKAYIENLRTLIDKGLVPHKVGIKHAHSMGMQVYYMFRMAMGGAPPPHCPSSTLFLKRPDLHMLDRDGTPLPKLSFAFPEVQQQVLSLMDEVLDDEVDGINICWIRGLRVIGYEKPVAEAFETEYGEDMRSVPEDDERVARIQSSFLTDFMRKVRRLTREAGQKRGRPIAVTAMVAHALRASLWDGCDIETWIREKLVDEMIGPAILTRYFQANGVKEVIYGGPGGPESYRRSAITLAETGADGLFIWDMNGAQDKVNHWAMLRRLGHTDEIIEGGDDKLKVKRIPLKMLGGIDVCHTQPWGGSRALVVYTGG